MQVELIEGAGGEQVLVLDPDLATHEPVDGRVMAEGAGIEVTPNAAPSSQHVRENRGSQRLAGGSLQGCQAPKY